MSEKAQIVTFGIVAGIVGIVAYWMSQVKMRTEQEKKALQDCHEWEHKFTSLFNDLSHRTFKFLVIGAQHGGKSGLVNSFWSLIKREWSVVVDSSPSNLKTKTMEVTFIPIPNVTWGFFDTPGFFPQDFLSPETYHSKLDFVKNCVKGIGLDYKPDIAVVVVNGEHYDKFGHVFSKIIPVIEEEKLPYVVVITHSDITPDAEKKTIEHSVAVYAHIDCVFWTTNFLGDERPLTDVEIKCQQYKLWYNIIKKIENHTLIDELRQTHKKQK